MSIFPRFPTFPALSNFCSRKRHLGYLQPHLQPIPADMRLLFAKGIPYSLLPFADSVNHFSRTNICLPSKFSQKAALIHARSKHSKTGVGRETRCGCCPGEAGSPQRGTAHRPPRSSEPLALRSSIFFQHASGASKVSADARSARGTSAPSPPSLRRAHALRCRVVHAGERTCGCVADTARDRARRYAPAGCACAALSSNDLPHLQTFSADRAHDGPAAVRADDFADC